MKKYTIMLISVLVAAFLGGCAMQGADNISKGEQEMNIKENRVVSEANKRTIYLAGGCFWGVEGYFKRIDGVFDTTTGYANGNSESTNYDEIKKTDHSETVKVDYDISRVSLEELLLHYFRIIDPTSVDKQGNDVGRQYRTGIYYVDEADKAVIDKIIAAKTEKYGKLAVETAPLLNFVDAEDYHQDYLEKNPGGYCHIDLSLSSKPLLDEEYEMPDESDIKKKIDDEAYEVMRNSATEAPFSSPLENEYRRGIYVDKITGEPLFSSSDKFDSGCGWPSFSKPILSDKLEEKNDTSHGMVRTEIRTKGSDSHLGHVFDDGPKDKGGLRYCINGAALKFIPYEEMDDNGYSEYKVLCD